MPNSTSYMTNLNFEQDKTKDDTKEGQINQNYKFDPDPSVEESNLTKTR